MMARTLSGNLTGRAAWHEIELESNPLSVADKLRIANEVLAEHVTKYDAYILLGDQNGADNEAGIIARYKQYITKITPGCKAPGGDHLVLLADVGTGNRRYCIDITRNGTTRRYFNQTCNRAALIRLMTQHLMFCAGLREHKPAKV
jgi:hypothetical protein